MSIITSSSDDSLRVCPYHENPFLIFCSNCRVNLCEDCLTCDRHRNHKFVKLKVAYGEQLDEAANRAKQMISKMKSQKDIQNQLLRARGNVEIFTIIGDEIFKAYETLQKRLEQTHNSAYLRIQAQKQSMIQGCERLEEEASDFTQKAEEIYAEVIQLKKDVNANDCIDTLGEIKELNSRIEEIENFDKTIEQRIQRMTYTNTWIKSLKNSVEYIKKKIQPWPWEFAVNLTFGKSNDANLRTSDNDTQVCYIPSRAKRAYPPKEKETFATILAERSFSSGCQYWEVEVKGAESWIVGVVESGWLENEENKVVGEDKHSWALQKQMGYVVALHNDDINRAKGQEFERLGIFLNYRKGYLQFYNADAGQILYSFCHKFKKTLYPAFSIIVDNKRPQTGRPVIPHLVLCDLMVKNRNNDLREGSLFSYDTSSIEEIPLAIL